MEETDRLIERAQRDWGGAQKIWAHSPRIPSAEHQRLLQFCEQIQTDGLALFHQLEILLGLPSIQALHAAKPEREAPAPPKPEEAYPEVAPLFRTLSAYIQPPALDTPSILARKLTEMEQRLGDLQRDIVKKFGDEKSDWPGSVCQPFDAMAALLKTAGEEFGGIRKDRADALAAVKKGAPTGQVAHYLRGAGFALQRWVGPLDTETQSLLVLKKGKMPQDSLETKWAKQEKILADNIKKAVPPGDEKEDGKKTDLGFPLSGALEEFRGRLGDFESEMGAMESRAKAICPSLRFVVSIDPVTRKEKYAVEGKGFTKEARSLFKDFMENVLLYRQAEAKFRKIYKSFESLQKKSETETLSEDEKKRQRELYQQAIDLKSRCEKHQSRADTALNGKEESGKEKPVRGLEIAVKEPIWPTARILKLSKDRTLEGPDGRTITVKEGVGTIDGVPIPLRGSERTQNRTLLEVASVLAMSPAELKASPDLAHPFYKEEVERRIAAGEPLRVLKGFMEAHSVVVVWDARFGTVFYLPYKSGWILKGARAMTPMIPGGGGARSTGATMVAPMIKLRNEFQYSTLTLDTPNHGLAVKDLRFHSLDVMMGWVNQILRYFLYLSGGEIPMVPIGRSFGDNLLKELTTRYPGVLDGAVCVSGYDPAWDEAILPELLRRIASEPDPDKRFIPNPTGYPMVAAFDGVNAKVENGTIKVHSRGKPQWTFLNPEAQEALGKTPMIDFSGTADLDYMGIPDFYRQRETRAKSLGHKMVIVLNGPHDLLGLGNRDGMTPEAKERMHAVYTAVRDFVEERIAAFAKQRPA